MSDLCHCIDPAPTRNSAGALYCLNCRLWYDEAAWIRDPRRKKALIDSREFTKEQQSIIDSIMNSHKEEGDLT